MSPSCSYKLDFKQFQILYTVQINLGNGYPESYTSLFYKYVCLWANKSDLAETEVPNYY